jgi:hypothetical protein
MMTKERGTKYSSIYSSSTVKHRQAPSSARLAHRDERCPLSLLASRVYVQIRFINILTWFEGIRRFVMILLVKRRRVSSPCSSVTAKRISHPSADKETEHPDPLQPGDVVRTICTYQYIYIYIWTLKSLFNAILHRKHQTSSDHSYLS